MKSNIALRVCLLLILLLVGLAFPGCYGTRTTPRGGSGAVVDGDTLYIGSMAGQLVAVNISDGNRLWDITLEGTPTSSGYGCAPSSTMVAIYGSPAVNGDLVYVGGYDGKIYEVDVNKHLSPPGRYVDETNRQPIISGPVVVGDRIYLGCADGMVYGLDGLSLDKVWSFETGDKVWSTPAIEGDTLYIGSFDKKLYALNTSDGSQKWEFKTEGAIVATPLVYNNTVYIGSFDRYLYAIDVSNGSLRWKFQAASWFWAKPVAYNNAIYAPCLDGKVYILNAEVGSEVADAIDLGSPIPSSPVLVGNKVIFAAENGIIYAIDADSNKYKEITRLETQPGKEEVVYAPLGASNGVVYIYTGSQNLYAIDVTSEEKLWSLSLK